MELDRKLCATRRKFLDALAPRRAVKARKKPASWLDDSFGMLSAYMLMSFYNFHERSAPRLKSRLGAKASKNLLPF